MPGTQPTVSVHEFVSRPRFATGGMFALANGAHYSLPWNILFRCVIFLICFHILILLKCNGIGYTIDVQLVLQAIGLYSASMTLGAFPCTVASGCHIVCVTPGQDLFAGFPHGCFSSSPTPNLWSCQRMCLHYFVRSYKLFPIPPQIICIISSQSTA